MLVVAVMIVVAVVVVRVVVKVPARPMAKARVARMLTGVIVVASTCAA